MTGSAVLSFSTQPHLACLIASRMLTQCPPGARPLPTREAFATSALTDTEAGVTVTLTMTPIVPTLLRTLAMVLQENLLTPADLGLPEITSTPDLVQWLPCYQWIAEAFQVAGGLYLFEASPRPEDWREVYRLERKIYHTLRLRDRNMDTTFDHTLCELARDMAKAGQGRRATVLLEDVLRSTDSISREIESVDLIGMAWVARVAAQAGIKAVGGKSVKKLLSAALAKVWEQSADTMPVMSVYILAEIANAAVHVGLQRIGGHTIEQIFSEAYRRASLIDEWTGIVRLTSDAGLTRIGTVTLSAVLKRALITVLDDESSMQQVPSGASPSKTAPITPYARSLANILKEAIGIGAVTIADRTITDLLLEVTRVVVATQQLSLFPAIVHITTEARGKQLITETTAIEILSELLRATKKKVPDACALTLAEIAHGAVAAGFSEVDGQDIESLFQQAFVLASRSWPETRAEVVCLAAKSGLTSIKRQALGILLARIIKSVTPAKGPGAEINRAYRLSSILLMMIEADVSVPPVTGLRIAG